MILYHRALIVMPILGILALGQGCGRPEPGMQNANLALLREGNFEQAAKRLEQAAAEDPGDAAVQCNLGLAYWKLGKTKEAVDALKTADRLSASDERPLEFLGQIYVAEGQLAEARRIFGLALERAPDSARIVTSQAVVEYYAGEFGKAGKLLKRAAMLDPDYAPALFNLGIMYRGRIGGKAKAIEYFTRYADMAPDGPRRQTAQDFVAKATGNAPPSPEPPVAPPAPKPERVAPKTDPALETLTRAKKAIAAEAFDEALILLSKGVKTYTNHPEIAWQLATLYDEQLDYPEKAREAYDAFRTRFPNDPRTATIKVEPPEPPPQPKPEPKPKTPPSPALSPAEAGHQAFREGVRHYRAGDWNNAIAAYKRAYSHDKAMVSALYNLGMTYKAAGDLNMARRTLEQALDQDPDMLTARYMLAVVNRELDDADGAIKQLETVLDMDPFYAKAFLMLGLIQRDAGNTDEARRCLQRFVNLQPDSENAKELIPWLEANPE